MGRSDRRRGDRLTTLSQSLLLTRLRRAGSCWIGTPTAARDLVDSFQEGWDSVRAVHEADVGGGGVGVDANRREVERRLACSAKELRGRGVVEGGFGDADDGEAAGEMVVEMLAEAGFGGELDVAVDDQGGDWFGGSVQDRQQAGELAAEEFAGGVGLNVIDRRRVFGGGRGVVPV